MALIVLMALMVCDDTDGVDGTDGVLEGKGWFGRSVSYSFGVIVNRSSISQFGMIRIAFRVDWICKRD